MTLYWRLLVIILQCKRLDSTLLAETWELEQRCVENCTCSVKFVTCETSMDVNTDALISHIGVVYFTAERESQNFETFWNPARGDADDFMQFGKTGGAGFNEQQDLDHTELLPLKHYWTAVLHRRLKPHLLSSGRYLRRTSTVTDDLDPIQSHQLHRSHALFEYLWPEKFDQARP